MKKIWIFSLTILGLLVMGRSAPAIDIGGYLENRLQVMNDQSVNDTNKFKLDFKTKADTYYLFISATGINNLVAPTNSVFELNRAYLDLYPSWGKITVGLQNITWGNGYLFNLPDQFNVINTLDPKGEKEGINAIATKWNITGTSSVEAVVLPSDKVSNSDDGIKGQFTVGLFDLSGYSIRRVNPNPALEERRVNILEVKGELGAELPGIWAQAGWFTDTPAATGVETGFTNYVLGGDYTFAIGNGLYLMAEYLQSDQITTHNQLYTMGRYSPEGYLTLSISGLQDLVNNTTMYSFNLKYILNDNIEISGMYNYYSQGSAMLGLLYNCNSEVIIAVKTSF
jgi:hypothetical protein